MDRNRIRDAARGRWLQILPALAPELADACRRAPRHVPCPRHGGKDGFRLFKDAAERGGGVCNTCGEWSDGFALLQWIHGWGFRDALEAVGRYVGEERAEAPPARPTPQRGEGKKSGRRSRAAKLKQLWEDAATHDRTLLIAYFRARGLTVEAIPDDLRFTPTLAYFETVDGRSREVGRFPAMLAAVRNVQGDGVSVHRTYLASDLGDKAAVEAPKKLMPGVRDGATRGAAVRLAPPAKRLAIAEGIETALAVMEATDTPAWAAITAGGMESLELPEVVRTVEIWADHDTNGRGQQAAAELSARMVSEGREVRVFIPPDPDTDWLDVLVDAGPELLQGAKPQDVSAMRAEPKSVRLDADDGDLAKMSDAVWRAVAERNDPPTLFQRGGFMTRIQLGDYKEPNLSILSHDALRGVLARWIEFYRWQDQRAVPALPPVHVVKDMMACPDMPLPIIARIVEAPVFGADGDLRLQPGYHPSGRTYFHDNKLKVPSVSKHPTPAERARAKELIVDELLGDFPFASTSELAHAVAALLGPFVRELIEGATPMHLIEAPSPGTGKSLLADLICMPATGRPAETMTEGRDEDEWRKRLTSVLLAGPTFLLIDNIRYRLDSAAVSSALTAQTWQDRILGRSEVVRIPVRTTWLATANNPALSTEISRRIVRIRLDAKVSRPWQRKGFRHKQIRRWALDHRGELVWAALTLVQAWLSAGEPDAGHTLGQYEQWARVVGGVLAHAEIEGFLGNADEVYNSADEEMAQWEAFYAVWWEKFGDDHVQSSDLFELADEEDLLLVIRGPQSQQSQKIRLGRALTRQKDRQVGPYRVVQVGENGRSKANIFSLVKVSDEAPKVDATPGGDDGDDSPY